MSPDSEVNRREFLKSSAKTGAAVLSGISFVAHPERVFGSNDRIRVAIVGLRGRGKDHIKELLRKQDVEIAAFCDVDENVLSERVAGMEKMGLRKPATFVDYRKLLEDKSIDAVTLATPNHWHALQAIWGCQAEKDVYVEKPCSHNWWESRQLVRTVEKYNRIVQHGTQSRSGRAIREAVQKLNEGVIGEVYLSRGLCYKWRKTIGHAAVESVPAGVDYDLWTGPAPMKPFTLNRFHYNWHWIWDTGNGDIGNQGVHEVDKARWGLGVTLPVKASAIGGHFMFDDDQETPNTLIASFEFVMPDGKRKMLEFAVRHWMTNHEAGIGEGKFGTEGVPAAGLVRQAAAQPKKSGVGSALGPDEGRQNTIGNIFYGSEGYLAIGNYDSYKTWLGKKQEPGPSGRGGGDHFANWLECVRTRKKENLNAPVQEAHYSCTLIHLANASYRLGRTIHYIPEAEEVNGDEEAARLLREEGRGYRAPFVVPENV